MPIPAGQSCSTCAYVDFAGPFQFYGREVTVDGVQIGYCRRTVPRPMVLWMTAYPPDRKSYVLGVEWPEVRADDWCGDWGRFPLAS